MFVCLDDMFLVEIERIKCVWMDRVDHSCVVKISLINENNAYTLWYDSKQLLEESFDRIEQTLAGGNLPFVRIRGFIFEIKQIKAVQRGKIDNCVLVQFHDNPDITRWKHTTKELMDEAFDRIKKKLTRNEKTDALKDVAEMKHEIGNLRDKIDMMNAYFELKDFVSQRMEK